MKNNMIRLLVNKFDNYRMLMGFNVSEFCKLFGISRSTYGRWLKGETFPDTLNIYKIRWLIFLYEHADLKKLTMLLTHGLFKDMEWMDSPSLNAAGIIRGLHAEPWAEVDNGIKITNYSSKTKTDNAPLAEPFCNDHFSSGPLPNPLCADPSPFSDKNDLFPIRDENDDTSKDKDTYEPIFIKSIDDLGDFSHLNLQSSLTYVCELEATAHVKALQLLVEAEKNTSDVDELAHNDSEFDDLVAFFNKIISLESKDLRFLDSFANIKLTCIRKDGSFIASPKPTEIYFYNIAGSSTLSLYPDKGKELILSNRNVKVAKINHPLKSLCYEFYLILDNGDAYRLDMSFNRMILTDYDW